MSSALLWLAASTTSQPLTGSIQANMRRRRVKARHQFLRHLLAQFLQLLATELEALLLGQLLGALVGLLLDHRGGSRRCSKPRQTSHWPPTACASTSLPSGDSQPRLSMSWLP